LKIVEATYCSIKHRTKYYATKEAVAEVALQTCYQTKKNKLQCTNVSNFMHVFFREFGPASKKLGARLFMAYVTF